MLEPEKGRSILRRARGGLFALCLSLLVLSAPPVALAASVLPTDLDAIIDGAATAFEGRCLASWSEVDPAWGDVVTYTSFEVREALKGSPERVHTIKQAGGKVGDRVSRVSGVPTFTPGEDYVVFLYGVSSAGFSSPVALSQGRFEIHAGPAGRVAGNGRDLRDLLPQVAESKLPGSVRAQAQAPRGRLDRMDLEEFKQLVRDRATR